MPLQVGRLGWEDRDLRQIAELRSRLIQKALEHHRNGAYEASVPILLAQVKGIVIDTAAANFFSRDPRIKAEVVDATDLATIEYAIGAVHKVFTEGAHATGATGSLSRHGILHGRELGYDTRATSAKCWSLLLAITKWARPRLQAEAERRRLLRQQEAAGSHEVDQSGRRLDDREFRETCRALTTLGTSAINWHRRNGAFREDLIGDVFDSKNFEAWGLPGRIDVASLIEGETAVFWRATISGWNLGLAVTKNEAGGYDYWYYSGAEPPLKAPTDDPSSWGGAPHRTPPDWTS